MYRFKKLIIIIQKFTIFFKFSFTRTILQQGRAGRSRLFRSTATKTRRAKQVAQCNLIKRKYADPCFVTSCHFSSLFFNCRHFSCLHAMSSEQKKRRNAVELASLRAGTVGGRGQWRKSFKDPAQWRSQTCRGCQMPIAKLWKKCKKLVERPQLSGFLGKKSSFII